MPLRFTTSVEREGNGFAAHCPELNLVGRGPTANDARRSLQDAIERHLEEPMPLTACEIADVIERRFLRLAATA
jgi:predicted RNase H-like HicB family nuclease